MVKFDSITPTFGEDEHVTPLLQVTVPDWFWHLNAGKSTKIPQFRPLHVAWEEKPFPNPQSAYVPVNWVDIYNHQATVKPEIKCQIRII